MIRTRQPAKPHISANTAKMKSVCRSGRKARRLCVAPLTPLPRSWPEPMAIFAWMTLYAVPERISERVDIDEEALPLVLLQGEPRERHEGHPGRDRVRRRS